MADLQTYANAILPEVKVYGSFFLSAITWLILIGIFSIIAGVVTYFIIQKRVYRNKIILFEKINGRWVDTGKDSAKEIKFGDLGMVILYCKKHKKYVARPSKQSGVRKWYFKVRGDGNWENFEFADDETSDKLKFYSVEKNITERNVGVRKGLQDKYNEKSWLKENAIILVSIAFIMMIGIMTWLLFDKWIDLAGKTNAGVEASGKVMEKAGEILDKLNVVIQRTEGSGYIEVPS